jgi:peptidoglycan/xylan/chitin deacetylase (PgdA/CDA1 family)
MTAGRPIPVLVWHKVDPRPEPGLTRISPRRFRRQLAALEGWSSLDAAEFVARNGRMATHERLVLLCFDDAYASVAEHAAPALAERGLSGLLFPVLDCIGADNRWDRGLLGARFRHLDGQGLQRLLSEGWSLGLHGRSHRCLAGASLAVLDAELVSARAELELRFGRSVHLLAWPWGRCDRRAVRIAQAAGLRLAFGRCRGPVHPFCLPRYHVYPHHGPRALAAMLAGAPEDLVQRLAGGGAWLSSLLGSRPRSA